MGEKENVRQQHWVLDLMLGLSTERLFSLNLSRF